MKKYQNLYSKWLYERLDNSYSAGQVHEIQILKYPFHTGLRVLSTDGYTYFDDIHCNTPFKALREFKRLLKQYKGAL